MSKYDEVWTTKQDEALRECAHEGVAAVRAMLYARFGIERSEHAIKMYASRQDISLRRQTRCPACGAPGVRLNRQSGLCRACSLEQNIERERIYSEMLEAERVAAEESPRVEVLEREYAKLRQRNARYRRKYGLKTKKRHAHLMR